jgi:hypothetical protein
MSIRDVLKNSKPHKEPPDPAPQFFSQAKRNETGRYRLEVDRQMKRSFTSFEEAKVAGQAIKAKHSIVKVAIYDVVDGLNTVIEVTAD